MCNLYRLDSSPAELARWFRVENRVEGANYASFVYPAEPGLVATSSVLGAMIWGFPLVRRGRRGQPLKPKPVNNARSDKLTGPFWRASFEKRRCLIPANGWAEAEGPRGAKTRTWLSLPGEEIFAFAGIWRPSEEWGDCYSMVIAEAPDSVREVHERMPVIIARKDHRRWLEGASEEALGLCRPWPGRITIRRTDQPWSGARAVSGPANSVPSSG